MADNEAFEATLDEWRKKATPAHLAVYATKDMPEEAQWRPYKHLLHINSRITDACTSKEQTFLNVACTVRGGKSFLISNFLPVWYLGMFPDRDVVIVSYSEDKAKEWGQFTLNLAKLVGPELFGWKVDEANSSKVSWGIQGRKGGLRAVGINGALTGRGIHLGIIDDPIKNREEAASATGRENMWSWYGSTFRTRLMPHGTVILTMARWHEDDLTGRIMVNAEEKGDEADPWEFIRMPAIAECPKGEDPTLWRDELGRAEGDPLWPEVWPADMLSKVRNSIGTADWESLYQQNPTPREGGMFKVDSWMRRPTAPDGLQRIRCWDLAATKDGGDWTVGVLMGRDHEDRFYVLDVQRFRMDGNEVKKQVLATARADGKGVSIRIEQERAGAGKAVIADYRRMLVGYNVIGVRPEGSKEQRAMPYASQQQDGNIYLVNSIGWEKEFIEEHRVFTANARHDDQVDAASGAFDELTQMQPASVEWNEEMSTENVVDYLTSANPYFANA